MIDTISINASEACRTLRYINAKMKLAHDQAAIVHIDLIKRTILHANDLDVDRV